MASVVKEQIKAYREAIDKMDLELAKLKTIFKAYFLTLYDVIREEKDSIVFPWPWVVYDVSSPWMELTKDKLTLFARKRHEKNILDTKEIDNSENLKKFLGKQGWLYNFSLRRLKKTMKYISEISVAEPITPEMVEEKYKELS